MLAWLGKTQQVTSKGPGAAEALRGLFLGGCRAPLAVQAAPA